MNTESMSPEISQEEYEARKTEMLQYYKKEMEFLNVQKEYETLISDIDEQRLRRALIQQKLASVYAPAPEEEEIEEESKPRSLKKQK
jgi:hypothetical protein